MPEDHPDLLEMSAAGFIRFIGSDGSIESVLTGNTEWYTPELYVNLARKVMGGIDLDPASNAYAQKVVKAEQFYTEDDDGLNQAWWGRVWLNPPYATPAVQQFTEKLCDEFEDGTVKQAILLTNNSTDTHWWQAAAKVATGCCLMEGRIRFYNPSGVSGSPTHGQTFLYFGEAVERFRERFIEFGVVAPLGAQLLQEASVA